MKKHLLTLPLLAALVAPATRAQINAAGGVLTLRASIDETYDSNIEGIQGGNGELITTLTPSVNYTRDQSLVRTDATLSMGIERDFSDSRYNQETYSATSRFALEKGTLGNYSVFLGANFSRGTSTNIDVAQRVRTTYYGINAGATVAPSERTELRYNINANKQEAATYGDQKTLSNSLEYRFGPFLSDTNFYTTVTNQLFTSSGQNQANVALDQNYTMVAAGLEKIFSEDLSARTDIGYDWFRSSDLEALNGTPNSSGMTISASLKGPFLPKSWLPKTTSSLSLNYSSSQARGIHDTGGKTLGGDLKLNWKARENTSLSLRASRTRRLSVNDLNVTTTDVSLGLDEKTSGNVEIAAALGYRWSTYTSLSPLSTEGVFSRASASYNFGARQNWRAMTAATYTVNSSAVASRDFDRYTTSVSLSYTF